MPDNSHSAPRKSRPTSLLILVGLLILEGLALAATTIFLVIEFVIAPKDSMGSAILLTIIVAITTVWVGFIIVGLLGGRAWTRAAVVVLQVLFIAVGLGSLQGSAGSIWIAAPILVPAIACLVLLFTKQTIAATSERSDSRTL
jgi:hypothetical protein